MKQGTKRLVSTLLSVLSLLVSVVLFFDFIKPSYQEAQQIRSEQLSRQAFIDSQKAAIQQAQELIRAYQGQGALQQQVSYALPTSTDTVGALIQLSGLELASNIQPDTFSVSPATLSTNRQDIKDPLVAPLEAVNFQISFKGTYESFMSFLEKLETNLRVFDVKNLNISQDQSSGGYQFAFSLSTYYQVPTQ